MTPNRLQTELSAAESAVRQTRFWRELAICWSVAGAAGFLFLVLRHLTGWSAPILWFLLVVGAVTAAGIVWQRYRRRPVDYRDLVVLVEREYPELRHLLATAVEQEPNPETGRFGFLQERVIDQALSHRQQHWWDRRFEQPLVSARRMQFVALGAFLVVLFALGASTPMRGPIFGSAPETGVTVTPGDASVERGAGLVISARFAGKPPAEATLTLLSVSGQSRSIPLARPLADPVFGASLPEVKEGGLYHIEYSGKRTRDFKITVFDYPALVRADATLSFPEYTGLAQKMISDTRRVSAVEGARLTYELQLNKPVAQARLIGKEDAIPLIVQSNAVAQLPGFTMSKSGHYALQLVDTEGRTNKMPAEFVLQTLSNRRPELKLTFPAGDRRVSALQEMEVNAEAVDDFGLLRYGIGFSVAGQEPQSIELGQSAPANEKRQMRQFLTLEKMGVQVDQLVSYFAWAEDYGPDGKPRRTYSDMYFAEVRPFEETYRRDQSGQQAADDRQNQGAGNGNESANLAELQKEIVIATWKLQRDGAASTNFVADAGTIKESQSQAREQLNGLTGRIEDPRLKAIAGDAAKQMDQAIGHLDRAASKKSDQSLPSAVSSEQEAYQSLLKLQPRDFRVAQNRNGRQGGGAGNQRNQRQLDQLQMRDESARYETETQATAAPTSQQREQLQTSSRLKELAQRQQDVNDRLRELQTALQEARTEQEREEIRRQLKRLHEDERQMLADVDELRQRLAQSQNATSLAQQRQQLDQIRNDVRNASDQLDRESVSQALANGSRAQQNLQQLGDDFRRQTSSQFTDQMRQLRNQARDLAREQEDLGRKLEALDQSQHKTLGDESERQSLAQGLAQQQAGLTNLLAGMRSVTDQAESTEPLLARQLYDTLRRSDQSHTDNLLDMGAQLVQRGFLPQAIDTERSARQNIEQLKQGVEQAAESVLGSETDALRYAQRELDELTKQVEREAAAGQTNNSAGPGRGALLRAPGENQTNQAPQTAGGETPAALGRGAMLRAPSDSAQAGATPDAGGPADNRGGGDGGNLEQMVRQLGAGGGGGYDGGPITGGNYLNWSDRLRDVEQVLDAPDLRNQVATVRERAAALRAEYRRNGRPPQLSVLQTQVVAPLTEVRTWLQQELARREGSDSLVPLDHDPVPDRYSDLVRRYYENLGSGQ